MKSTILLGSLLIFGLTSCVGTVSTESKKATSERKIIMPEGYNRGLPFTPGILLMELFMLPDLVVKMPKTVQFLKNLKQK